MGEAFAADLGVAEDGAVRPLDCEADSGVLACHIGYATQGRTELGPVTITRILRGQSYHFGLFRAKQGIQRKQAIQLAEHYGIAALLAEESLAVAKRINIQITPIFQRVAPEQVNPIARASAITGNSQFRKFRMAGTVRQPVVQKFLVRQILENGEIFCK